MAAARGEREFKLTADREHIVPRFGCGINDFIGSILHIIKTDFKRVSDDILSVPNQRFCCHLQGATITLIAITHREGSHQLDANDAATDCGCYVLQLQISSSSGSQYK